MKLVKCIVCKDKVDETTDALKQIDLSGVTVTQVLELEKMGFHLDNVNLGASHLPQSPEVQMQQKMAAQQQAQQAEYELQKNQMLAKAEGPRPKERPRRRSSARRRRRKRTSCCSRPSLQTSSRAKRSTNGTGRCPGVRRSDAVH